MNLPPNKKKKKRYNLITESICLQIQTEEFREMTSVA